MRDFRGKRVAIDGYSWLHKGAYCCSTDLCMGRPTDKYVTYFMSRVDVLTSSGLTPVVVSRVVVVMVWITRLGLNLPWA